MHYRIGLASVIACFAVASDGAAARQAVPSEAAANDIQMVWYPTAECPDRKEGPGATPATAIAIEAFDEIYQDVLDGIETDNEAKAETPSESRYECRWVRISGYFQWTDYYHYRGYLYEDLPSAYFGAARNLRYIVENFRAPEETRTRVNGARVTVTGRFYDLCRRAAMDVGADAMVFGPCHYGDLKGLMLKDVIVDSVEAGPNLRLSGERNRELVGDLAPAPDPWGEAPAVKAAFFDWLRALRGGREAYWKVSIARWPLRDENQADALADALEDRDDWVSFLIESDTSPLAKQSNAALSRRPFRVFVARAGADEENPDEAVACVCLSRDCRNDWPLFEHDAERFADKYLCRSVMKDDGGWKW